MRLFQRTITGALLVGLLLSTTVLTSCESNMSRHRGYIDETGAWVISAKYNGGAHAFSDNGLAAVDDPETKLGGYIDETGEWVIEPRFQYVESFGDNGLAPVLDKETNLWGYIDETGEWVIEPTFLVAILLMKKPA